MKKFFNLALIICLAISLIACGDATKEADKLAATYEFNKLVDLYRDTDLSKEEREYVSDVITKSGTEYILQVLEESEDELYEYEIAEALEESTFAFYSISETHPDLYEAYILIRDIMWEINSLESGNYASIKEENFITRDFYVESRVQNANHFEVAGIGNSEYIDQYVCTDAEYNYWLDEMVSGGNEKFILMSDSKVQKGYHDYCTIEFVGYNSFTTLDGFEVEIPVYEELSDQYCDKVLSILYDYNGDAESYVKDTIQQNIYLIRTLLDTEYQQNVIGEQIAEDLWYDGCFYALDLYETHSIYSLAERDNTGDICLNGLPEAYTILDVTEDQVKDVVLMYEDGGLVVYEDGGEYYAYAVDNYTIESFSGNWIELNW